MSLIARIPSALFIVAVPLFLVTASVTWAFNSPGVYQGGFERYDVSRITGITDAIGDENLYRSDEWLGKTTRRAYADAQSWIDE